MQKPKAYVELVQEVEAIQYLGHENEEAVMLWIESHGDRAYAMTPGEHIHIETKFMHFTLQRTDWLLRTSRNKWQVVPGDVFPHSWRTK